MKVTKRKERKIIGKNMRKDIQVVFNGSPMVCTDV